MKKAAMTSVVSIFLTCAVFLGARAAAVADAGGADPFAEGVALYYNGQLEESLARFREAVKNDPKNDSARLNLIRLLQETGRFEEALAQLNLLVEEKPADAQYRVMFLETCYLAGRPETAVALSTADDPTAEELYWRGLALIDLGKEQEASQILKSSLEKEPFNPMANFLLGRISLNSGDFDSAQTYLKRAVNQEPNLTAAYFPLAQTYLALGKYASASVLLRNAVYFSPWDQKMRDALTKLESEHPELLQQYQEEIERRRRVDAPPSVTPISEGREKIPEIRIGLAENVQQLYVKTGDRFTLSAADATNGFSGEGRSVLLIRQTDDGIEVLDEKGASLFRSTGSLTLSYENPAASTILFAPAFGPGAFLTGREDRIYRGSLEFIPIGDGLTIVNRVNLEEYLYSVVPSEMPPSWPSEALKAQAVAARTYALANIGAFSSRGFDLLATTASQVYSGVKAESAASTAAVDATRGQILTYQGKPIAAFFTGNNGGVTESSKDLWNFEAPYLQIVPDPLLPPRPTPLPPADLAEWLANRPPAYSSNPKYSSRSSYRWVLWVPSTDIENRLGLGDKLGRIVSVAVIGRSVSGMAYRVLVKGTNGEFVLSGDAIRPKLGGLRSNLFVVLPKLGRDGLPEHFVFTGGGWGHGVGMCQSGAAGMADAGFTFDKILSHYYPGTELTKRY